jgi:iron complex outermembrane receptor protein
MRDWLSHPTRGFATTAWLCTIVTGLAFGAWAVPAGAQTQEPTTSSVEENPTTDTAETNESEPTGGTAAEAETVEPTLEGIEVFQVKGRAVTAIEAEVPTSITQFDAAAIAALGAQNISDLAKVTPNVEIVTTGSTSATFFIRGVGLSDFGANATGAVTIMQDDVVLNAPALQLGQLFDIENVNVLRGPEGGGPHRNASAGAIKITSRKPIGELGADLKISLGSYYTPLAYDAFIQDYEGALEIPIIEEVLAARLSFRFEDAEPFRENRCGGSFMEDRVEFNRLPFPGNQGEASVCGEVVLNNQFSTVPEGLPTRVNDSHSWATRAVFRFQPPDTDMEWLLNLHGSRRDQLSTLGEAIGTGSAGGQFGGQTGSGYIEPDQDRELCTIMGFEYNETTNRCGGNFGRGEAIPVLAELLASRPLDQEPYKGSYNLVGDTRLDTWGASLRGDMSVGPVNITSISGYDEYRRFRSTDTDFTPTPLFEVPENRDKAFQVWQNFELHGELEDFPVQWKLGAYSLYEELEVSVVTDLTVGRTRRFARDYTQETLSFAGYGGFSWDFLDDFTLEGRVRYNWERKKLDFIRTPNLNVPEVFDQQVDAATFKAPTGTIALTYRFSEEVSAYWKYARGFKAGHFNTSSADLASNAPARPESIDAFEVGFAGRWFDGGLSLRGSLFHYDYTDYQVFRFVNEPGSPPTLEIVNAQRAEVYGAELDMRAEPLAGWVHEFFENLVLQGRLGWLESRFLEFTSLDRVVDPTVNPNEIIQTVLDFSGNPLISSPKFAASGSAEWTFDLGRWGSIIPRYDFSWSAFTPYDANEGNGGLNFDRNTALPEGAIGMRAHFIHNLRLTYRTPEGNIELSAWVRNLEDTVVNSYAFDAQKIAKVVINFPSPPRSVGADITINW